MKIGFLGFGLEVSKTKGSIKLGPYGVSYCLIEDYKKRDREAKKFPMFYFGRPIGKWLIRKHTPYFKLFSWTRSKSEWGIRFWGSGISVLDTRKIDELAWCDQYTFWKRNLTIDWPNWAGSKGKLLNKPLNKLLNGTILILEYLLKFEHRKGRVPAIRCGHRIIKYVVPFRY